MPVLCTHTCIYLVIFIYIMRQLSLTYAVFTESVERFSDYYYYVEKQAFFISTDFQL